MNWVSIGSDNGLSPIRRQAIILTNAGLLSIGPLGTKFSQILIKIHKSSFTKISSVKWRPFCPGGDELSHRSVLRYLKRSHLIFWKYLFSENLFAETNEKIVVWVTTFMKMQSRTVEILHWSFSVWPCLLQSNYSQSWVKIKAHRHTPPNLANIILTWEFYGLGQRACNSNVSAMELQGLTYPIVQQARAN